MRAPFWFCHSLVESLAARLTRNRADALCLAVVCCLQALFFFSFPFCVSLIDRGFVARGHCTGVKNEENGVPKENKGRIRLPT